MGDSPLLKVHNSRTLVLQDGLVRVHADIEFVAQLAGLEHGAGMAVVKEVPTSVDPDTAIQDLWGRVPWGRDGICC